MDRIGDIFSAAYRELVLSYKRTDLSYCEDVFDPDRRWSKQPMNGIKLPIILSIEAYLQKVKSLKLEAMGHEIQSTSSRILFFIERRKIIHDSLVLDELGIPLNTVSLSIEYLLSKGKVVEGIVYLRDTSQRVRVFAIPEQKNYGRSSELYQYVKF